MSIKQEIVKGVFWIALAKYSGLVISLVVTAILARHISPAAFGTIAVATVIMAFLDILSDMGLGVAIVQFKNLTIRQIHSLFTINIGIAIVLTSILYFSSTPIARYYDDRTLISVIHWLCVSLFFNALNIVPNGLMLKNKRFRDIAIRTLLFQVISGSAACTAALHGWGIKALLISPVITSIGVFAFNFISFPQRPVWPIDVTVVKQIWSYSSFQFLFSFINYFSRNADKLIIGKYLSMKDLGYYDKSYRLMQLPLQNITFVITPVLHPILSTLQDDKQELSNKNIHLAQILSYISFPLGIFLFFGAGPIISIMFGSNWIPAIPVFRILAISVPLQIILSTSGSIFQTAGKTNHMFYCGLQSAICTVAVFIISAYFFKTIEAMAIAWDIALVINFCFCYWLMYRHTFKIQSIGFFRRLMPQILNSSVTVIFVCLMMKALQFTEPLLQIIWVCVATAIPTLTMATILHQYNIRSVLRPIIGRLRPQKTSSD